MKYSSINIGGYFHTFLIIICLLPLTPMRATDISGIVNASSLADNAELKLTGSTTLNMDVAKTLKSISGKYELTIQGSNKLSVINSGGNAIDVKAFSSSTSLYVNAKKEGIAASQSVDITNGEIEITAGKHAIYAENGHVNITAVKLATSTTASQEACIQAGYAKNSSFTMGDIDIICDNITVDAKSFGVYAVCGNISITGNADITSTKSAGLYALSIDFFGTIYGEGNVTLSGVINTSGKTYAACASGDLKLLNGSITSTGCLYGGKGVNLSGTVNATAASDTQAIWSNFGDVNINGVLRAVSTSSKKSCIQAGYIDNTGYAMGKLTINSVSASVISAGDGLNAAFGDITLTGNLEIKSKNGTAIWGSGTSIGLPYGDIIVNKGTQLVAEGKSYGIASCGKVIIREGYVEASGSEMAIYSYGETISIDESIAIVAPVGGHVSGTSIADRDENIATYVRIGVPTIGYMVSLTNVSPAVGDVLSYSLTGPAASLAAEDIITEWQRSNDGETGWTAISSEKTYSAQADDFEKYVRVVVRANGYNGYLTTNIKQVLKKYTAEAATEPTLTVNSSNKVVISNAKANQEYIITTTKQSDYSTIKWTNSQTVSADGELVMTGSTNGKVNYVYTRVKETTSTYAGTNVKMAYQYIGSAATTQSIKLTPAKKRESAIKPMYDNLTPDANGWYNAQVGDVIRLTASSVPADATDFESIGGIKGSDWDASMCTYKGEPYEIAYDGLAVNLYANSACTQELDANTYYKSVYMKLNLQVNALWITAESTNADDNTVYDIIMMDVADDTGFWPASVWPQYSDYSVRKGNTLNDIPLSHIGPAGASLENVTVEMTGNGTAPTAILDKESRTVTFDATIATKGTYKATYYVWNNTFKYNIGSNTVYVTSIEADEIQLLPGSISLQRGQSLPLVAQTFPADNDSEVTWTSDNPDVVSVSADGVICAADDAPRGSKVTITATANGHEAICEVTVPKLVPELSFGEYTDEIDLGEEFTAPILDNPASLPVTYSSDDTNVAIVDATTGKVTLVGEGVTTISAYFGGNDTYEAGWTEYTLTVTDDSATGISDVRTSNAAHDDESWYCKVQIKELI